MAEGSDQIRNIPFLTEHFRSLYFNLKEKLHYFLLSLVVCVLVAALETFIREATKKVFLVA